MIMLASIALTIPVALQGAAAQGDGMKLLLVDIDDVGYDLLRDTPTPTLDWLEANGRFFTSFTTAPTCSPTRAMVNTGAYPTHPSVLIGSNVGASDTYSLPLGPLEPLAAAVASAGFSTAKVGKWHLAPVDDPTHVLDAGWQSYRGSLSNLRTGGTNDSYFNFRKWTDGVESQLVGRYATTDESNDAIDYLRSGVQFVSLSYHAPHVPVHLPPVHLRFVTPLVTDYDRTRAMLAACDAEFGRVLREAVRMRYRVIVFADNGTSQTIGGQKATLFEGGIVTPFWAFGPGIVPGYDDTRVGAQDLYDTVLDLFGIDATHGTRGPQSQSMVRLLSGREQYHRWAYSERYEFLGVDPRTAAAPWPRALRSERFKLMRDQSVLGDRFFDLWADPGETTDLLGAGALDSEAQAAYDYLRRVFDSL